MICIYNADEKDFSTNGLGIVKPISCTVSETLNGEWELQMDHLIDEEGTWTRLVEGRILRAPVPAATTPRTTVVTQTEENLCEIYIIDTDKDSASVRGGTLRLRTGPGEDYTVIRQYKNGLQVQVIGKPNSAWYEVIAPDGQHGYMDTRFLRYVRTESDVQTAVQAVVEARQLRDQPFRIYRVVPQLTKVTVYARHIFYDLLDNMIKLIQPSSMSVGAGVAQRIAAETLSPHNFTFYSDLLTTAEEVSFENVNPVEAILGDGGLAEKYGAELARDWFDVFLVKRVGSDFSIHIREGKNLLGISYDVDETSVTTRIMPTGQDADGNVLYLPELYVDSPLIGNYPHPKWIHLQVSEAKENTEGDEPKSREECFAEMRAAAQEQFASGCDLPDVTLNVDFINCVDTEEYKQYHFLQNVFLGDSVRVTAKRIGIEVTLRMTQYTYDCLLERYTSVTLGTVSDALEGNTISMRQLASGSITGAKLAINSVGTGQLQSGSVGSVQIKNAAIQSAHIQDAAITSAHIQEASITRAHIAEALIETLNVNALTAVSAKIQELAAGQITTDELYTSIAMIAAAQITTANIVQANIRWADIENLAADVARIAKAQITAANIDEANIEWASVTSLTAAVASIVSAQIGSVDIDFARIKDMVTDTAIITQGSAGELYIARLAVTEANMVSLTVGELIVKGGDGRFYALTVDEDGQVKTEQKQISNDDVEDVSINAGEKIIEGSVTAATLNAQDIFAENALIQNLIAAHLDVTALFAREATIAALNATDITSNSYLRLMVSGKADQADVEALGKRVDEAELKITDEAIVATVIGSEKYQQDRDEIIEKLNSGQIFTSSTPPENPIADTLWLDTSVEPNMLRRWDGEAWRECGADVDLSEYYTKSEMDTRFEQTDKSIGLKADKTTTDALGNRLESAEATLTTQAGQISAAVSAATSAKTAVDGLVIGARNYFLGSGRVTELNSDKDTNVWLNPPLTTSDDFLPDCKGKPVTISVSAMTENLTKGVSPGAWIGIQITYNLSTGTTSSQGFVLSSRISNGTMSWTRYSSTVTVPVNAESVNNVMCTIQHCTGLIRLKDAQLELGSKASSYSPAPEELQITKSSTAPAKPVTDQLWLDTSVSPPILKRWTGSAWTAVAAEEVHSSGIFIAPNNVRISTENFILQLLDAANNENVLMEMRANGNVGFKELYADEVVSPSVMAAYHGPDVLVIDMSFTGTSDGTYRSFADALKEINGKYISGQVTIVLPGSGDLYEPGGIGITGVCGGTLLILSTGACRLNSYVVITGCSAHIKFQQVSLREVRAMNGSSRNGYFVSCYYSHLVEFENCTLDANSTTYDTLYDNMSHVVLSGCGLYNAIQGVEVYMGWVNVYNCKGSCSWSMVAYAGFIIAAGTVPAGSVNAGNNGQVYYSGVTTNYGTAISPGGTPNTTTQYATLTRSWQGTWRTDTVDVVQGVYSDYGYSSSLGWNCGCMWFGNLRNVLAGATIRSATITFYRKPGSGSFNARMIYLYAISNTTASGTPQLAANFGALGYIGRSEQMTFALPLSCVQGLANGTYAGLCLYETPYNFGNANWSDNYMRMAGTDDSVNKPYITVVYTSSAAG